METKYDNDDFQTFESFYRKLGEATHEEYKNLPFSKVLGPDAFDEQRRHLLEFYKDIEVQHSFIDSAGQVFDCVPVESQPALRKLGKPLAKPPMLPTGPSISSRSHVLSLLGAGRKDSCGNQMACPAGTVPIRRITLKELSRFETLNGYFKKIPRNRRGSSSHLILDENAPDISASPHEYAHAYQTVPNLGGHSFLNIWSPAVSGSETFSLSQQWYVATGSRGVQTAEVGWQVFPQLYGHSKPVLFTYWTADGYASTGSYSLANSDFVQSSSTCPLGMALDSVSVSGGEQSEIEVSFILSDGNWWLFVNGTESADAVGYYPSSLYENGPMATGAAEVDYGGETVGTGVYPPMGSGSFAAQGYKFAAYQRNIYFYPTTGGVQEASLNPVQDWPNSYTISLQSSVDWGAYFFFGGPGSSPQPTKVALDQSLPDSLGTIVTDVLDAVLKSVGRASTAETGGLPSIFREGLSKIDVNVQKKSGQVDVSVHLGADK
jgi:hypothetical protein